ncbi:MAG: carboxyltransferase domain-containing protein, partial [Mycobacterium sp.]|nr:carboxyltransferase domain-containing protein [Mycobacterium sp.]
MIRRYGDRALLIECASTAEVLARADVLRSAELPGVHDIVPGARTILLSLADPGYQASVRTRLEDFTASADSPAVAANAADIVIEVAYDGADLAEVAERLGMETAAVVEAPTGSLWRGGVGGFPPGFSPPAGGGPPP